VNGPDFGSQHSDLQFVRLKSDRYSGGFPIYPKSDDKVTIMLDFRVKAASMEPRRSSGVRSLHDSRASGRVNKSGPPQSQKERTPVYFSEPKRIVQVL
jgi:hypothetical protein